VLVTNAVNLIDGLDGLAVGVSSISTVSVLLIALLVREPNVAILAAALSGASLGFLPYNFNPAKIFMGDTGSTFLGYMLAALSIMGLFKAYAIVSFVIPFLILGLPIFDTVFAILRRLFTGQPIMKPDRGHLHHRLMDMGLTQKQTVLILYAISSILGFSAVLSIGSGYLKAGILILTTILTIAVAAWFLTPKKIRARNIRRARRKRIKREFLEDR